LLCVCLATVIEDRVLLLFMLPLSSFIVHPEGFFRW
jgi:hypothetical protein